jgi:hypothetical protein
MFRRCDREREYLRPDACTRDLQTRMLRSKGASALSAWHAFVILHTFIHLYNAQQLRLGLDVIYIVSEAYAAHHEPHET